MQLNQQSLLPTESSTPHFQRNHYPAMPVRNTHDLMMGTYFLIDFMG